MNKIGMPFSLVTAMLACAASPRTARAQEETPEWAKVVSVDASGTGCPPGSYTSLLFPDKRGFQLTFLKYGVQAPTGPIHKFCNTRVVLSFPSGWAYGFVTVSYRGFGSLQEGLQGIFKSTYWFPATPSAYGETRLTGPFLGPFEQRDKFGLVSWSPCNAQVPLTIKTELGLSNASIPGYMVIEDQELVILYGLTWKRC